MDRLIQINILQYIPNILILRQFQVICLIFSMQGTITEQLRIIILLSLLCYMYYTCFFCTIYIL